MKICADDFGLADDINEAILDLATHRHIHAVSCMVNFHDRKPGAFDAIQPLSDRVALGLHWTLTEGRSLSGLSFSPFMSWLSAAYIRRIPEDRLFTELTAQYRRFTDWFERAPAHIDSHQHVHQLPGISDILIRFVQALPEQSRPLIRNTGAPLVNLLRRGISLPKVLCLAVPGWALKRKLRRVNLRTNSDFAGVYNYNHWHRYPFYFKRFVAQAGDPSALLMVHPGSAESWRAAEYRQLRLHPSDGGDEEALSH